jgi:4-phospho-D-threonate 3-dehydrogenase / 4-phospho-D-erythronate 3-dehydrogenase
MASKKVRPLIGITLGDPAGVGPEIILKALSSEEIYFLCRPLVIGDAAVLKAIGRVLKTRLRLNPVESPDAGAYRFGTADVIDLANVEIDRLEMGKVSRMAGKASLGCIYRAIDLARAGQIHGVVTAPIHKKAIHLAGSAYAGHTDLFAGETGIKDFSIMLVTGDFRVAHVTLHVPLKKALEMLTKQRVLNVIRLTHQAMKDFGISQPRIAVPGLNPHAGDRGLFGDEDRKIILPAVKAARKEGIDAEGPLPPDSAYVLARGGRYDAALALYHDQGHIPAKLLGWAWDEKKRQWTSMRGVGIILGLPILRTTPDHGVGFEIAGQGKANPQAMLEAIRLAARMAAVKMRQC